MIARRPLVLALACAPLGARLGALGAQKADTTRYVVLNHGTLAGDLTVARGKDSLVVRYVFTDRNRGTRIENRYRLGAGGAVVAGESRPVLADGTVGAPTEAFAISGDSARFTTFAGGRGGAAAAAPMTSAVKVEAGTMVALRSLTPWEAGAMAKFLLAQPKMSGRILMAGAPARASRADVVSKVNALTAHGAVPVRFVAVYVGTAGSPQGVWLDGAGTLFSGEVTWFIAVRAGAERALPALRAVEVKFRNAEGERVAGNVRTKAGNVLAITNGDVFDAERGVMLPKTTVIVRGGRIAEVGPAASVATPAGATVIDATGKTVMPGMWEMHAHLQLASQSTSTVMQLAQGITTSRDMAADVDVATSTRDREAKGLIASPRYILGGFMEGPLKWRGPTDVLVSTEAQALAWVAKYDALGYKQIKLYNVIHPDLVPVVAAEAHRRGMRLSGHIPRGLSVQAAVGLGFDEVNHAAFLFSNFFQDSLYLPQMRAYSQVATAVAPNFNVDGPQMTELIAYLRDHRTVVDGTFSVWIGGSTVAQSVGAGVSSDQARSDAAYMRLLTRLHDAGVTLVAGTDNFGSITYHRELELYEQAGIPAPEVLQIATIGAARVMKQDAEYGTIAAGKVADIAIVNGRPATHVTDLGKVETVIRGGRVYAVADLMAAVSGRRGQ